MKVVFGVGRQTAQAIVGDLFIPDPQSIKHAVKDEIAQERSHPLFDPLNEQVERFTQTIQRLRRRTALIKLPEHDHVFKVRVPTIPHPRIHAEKLEDVKEFLARQVGKPRKTLEDEIAVRAQTHQTPFRLAEQPKRQDTHVDDFWV